MIRCHLFYIYTYIIIYYHDNCVSGNCQIQSALHQGTYRFVQAVDSRLPDLILAVKHETSSRLP